MVLVLVILGGGRVKREVSKASGRVVNPEARPVVSPNSHLILTTWHDDETM